MDNLPAGVSTKKVNGIWYFDYTDAMNKVLTENEKVVLEHQIPLYEDYVAEVGKNLTWFGRLSRQKTLLPTISPDIFFHAPLSVGFGQIWKAAGFDWGGMT